MDLRDVPNLDLVRAVAVISVVVEHVLLALGVMWIGPFPIEDFGVLGVLVFFVLTALVLMWSLQRRPDALDFYIRRCFRLYPLAWTAMAIALVTHAPTGGSPAHFFIYAFPSVSDIVAQASLLHVPGRQVMSVMWSLPYEMEMYILLPALFLFVRQTSALWPLMTLWILVVVNSVSVPSNGHNFAVAIGYFLPGVMAYVGFGRWRPSLPGWLLPFFLLTIWPLALWRFNFHRAWLFCLIVGLTLPIFRQVRSEAILAPSRIIAKYSYGVYLMHPFAIVVGVHLLRNYSPLVRVIGGLIPLLVLPVGGYHLIEAPMIRMGSRVAQRMSSRSVQREMQRLHDVPTVQS